MPRFERIEVAEDVERCFLNKIARVEATPRTKRQAAVRPAFEGRQTSFEQCFHCRSIPPASPDDERQGRLIAQ
jgi:hypothetical protein